MFFSTRFRGFTEPIQGLDAPHTENNWSTLDDFTITGFYTFCFFISSKKNLGKEYLKGTVLFPRLSYKVLGVLGVLLGLVKGLNAISCWGNINFLLPSYHYYSVTSVQIFIIHPRGEDYEQPLHREFLPRQSTSLPTFLMAPDNVCLHLTL